jgi:hypothetical protein
MSTIPESVRAFVAEHFTSLVPLEVLLLLRGDPVKRWPAEAVARELGIDASWAAKWLADLQGRGFAAADDGTPTTYRYQPATAELDTLIGALATAYAQRRVAVTELIFAKATGPVRTFAAAFRIRKDDKDG